MRGTTTVRTDYRRAAHHRAQCAFGQNAADRGFGPAVTSRLLFVLENLQRARSPALKILPLVPAWDESLVILAMIASVEAIFLSTFVLINQNRTAEEDNDRADLDLQITLLNEHETTRLIAMMEAIAARLNVETDADDEIRELKRDVAPEAVLEEIKSSEGYNPGPR